jgi:hypothetical protein
MSRFTDWLLNLPERRAQARERRREREVQSAHARRGSDPNPSVGQRHGESDRMTTNYKGPPGR